MNTSSNNLKEILEHIFNPQIRLTVNKYYNEIGNRFFIELLAFYGNGIVSIKLKLMTNPDLIVTWIIEESTQKYYSNADPGIYYQGWVKYHSACITDKSIIQQLFTTIEDRSSILIPPEWWNII